jgi:hypothetical protein
MTPLSTNRKSALGIASIALTVPVLFWLKFGRIDQFAIAFTGFLVLLTTAIEFLPRAADARNVAPAPGKSKLDFLGPVWLLSIPFAPFFSWALTSAFDVNLENWRWLLGVRAFMCVVLPIVSALSLLRFVRRGVAGIALLILVVGTAFPVLTAAGSAYDVVKGPSWEAVKVEQLEDIDFRTGAGTHVHKEGVYALLEDGRRLGHSEAVKFHLGPAKLLILHGFQWVLDAAP